MPVHLGRNIVWSEHYVLSFPLEVQAPPSGQDINADPFLTEMSAVFQPIEMIDRRVATLEVGLLVYQSLLLRPVLFDSITHRELLDMGFLGNLWGAEVRCAHESAGPWAVIAHAESEVFAYRRWTPPTPPQPERPPPPSIWVRLQAED